MSEPVFTPEQEARIRELLRGELADKDKQIATVNGSFVTTASARKAAALVAHLREHGLLGRS